MVHSFDSRKPGCAVFRLGFISALSMKLKKKISKRQDKELRESIFENFFMALQKNIGLEVLLSCMGAQDFIGGFAPVIGIFPLDWTLATPPMAASL